VIGISADPPERNLAWTKQLTLPFRLLSDGDGRTARAYGVWDPTWNLPKRVTFIIDRARRIRFVEAGSLAIDTGRTLEALARLARAS
jgi:peroxiredoxin